MSSESSLATRIALAPAPEELATAAALDVPVLVSAGNPGERSTYARLLHARSSRSERPFVEVQCGGRAPGSRPRPMTALKTSFVRADGGTLYLDEIDALDIIRQAWLCSHITEELLTRRVRVISGSDGSLAARVADGSFEPHLFYRLNVIHIDRT
jgi:DNA-binding NtrC family response regulator